MPFLLETKEDMLFIHIEEGINAERICESVEGFSYSKNLRVVMTCGFMSEAMHDAIDNVIENSPSNNNSILTMWSEDGLADSLWEFINIHGEADGIKTARLLIITATSLLQDKILYDLGYRED